MTAKDILEEIKPLGSESYRKVLYNHGVNEPCFGVKISDLKKIQKRIKTDYKLALDLYSTGIYDAMYLAGLVADDAKMTCQDLEQWVEKASGPLAGYTVPWVASGSCFGRELALKWINSGKENIVVAGWGTLSSLVSIKDDKALNLSELKDLLERVKRTIHTASGSVRYQMNQFVICVGCYVKSLTDFAKQTAIEIGKLEQNIGKTACQVPSAIDYIEKVEKRNAIGKKRKTAKC